MNRAKFTIDYYEGAAENMPPLKKDHNSIAEAGQWCKENKLPLSMIIITEWNLESLDAYGDPNILGICNLDEAIEAGYNDLTYIF